MDDSGADPFDRTPGPEEPGGPTPGPEQPAPVKRPDARTGTARPSTRTSLRVRRRFGSILAGWARAPHDRRRSLQWSALVVAALVAGYWFAQWPLPRLLSSNPSYNFYLVQPVLWTAVALLAVYGWLRLEDRPPFSRLLIGIAALVGLFHVAVLVIAGVLWGFGSSPAAGKLINYPKNLLYFSTVLAAAEASRAYLFWVWRRRDERLAYAATTLLLFAFVIPAAQWSSFGTLDQSFRVVGGRWLPALALSLLCTWLAAYGGLGPSFAYRFMLVAFEWWSPLLPNLRWPMLLALGMAVPLVSSWLIPSIYEDTAEGRERKPAPEPEPEQEAEPRPLWARIASWGATGVAVLLLVLFATGVFGYHLSVVDGRSMEPAFSRGDLLIVDEGVDPGSLEVGDIIEFRLGNLPVVHRIIGIEEAEDGLVFTTRGDNQDREDDPILAGDIDGKVVFAVPWVGQVNLLLRGR